MSLEGAVPLEWASALPCELIEVLVALELTCDDLIACGSAPFHLLRTIFPLLHGTPTPSSTRRAATLADSLLRLSNERILCYNYKEVPTHWRRLYTDATLLHVLAALSSSRSPADLLSGIRSLDLILIVAGAPGPSRPSLVFSLITHAQSLLPPTTSKRPKLSPRPTLPSPHLTSRISSLTIPPSLSQFLALISQGPFILRSGCSDWPALSRWSSFAYLRSLAGPGRVVPVELGGNYTSEGWGQRILPFEEFLQSLESEGGEKLYLAQHDLFRQFPELERDVAVPDYVYSAPEAEGYEAPGNEEGYVMNAWLGPEGTVSPAHTDPYFNCYAQVVGKKWIWVAPPSALPSMYTFGSSLEPLAMDDDEEKPDSSTSHFMTNTSRIDVTEPPDSTKLLRYPSFLKDVVPVAQQAVLEEGDLLFMPPDWWHSMKSLSVSFSVSIWF